MNFAILLIILIMCWALTLAVAFALGFMFLKTEKYNCRKVHAKNENHEDIDELQKKEKQEYENFMNYRGIPQLGHKDYE